MSRENKERVKKTIHPYLFIKIMWSLRTMRPKHQELGSTSVVTSRRGFERATC